MGASIISLVFQPPEISYAHAKKHIVWLKTKNHVNIPAFYIDRKSIMTILFSHGNAEDIGMIYEWFCEFTRELHVNMLAYDYEGYGKASSTGKPSENACYNDIDAAYTFLTNELKTPPQNIIVYGRSIGSGPSCYLVERLSKENVKIGGLILQSPLLSIYRIAFNFRFTFPGDMFPNIDRIANINCPLQIIHGTRDEIVPFWNGEQLFFSAPLKWRAKPIWVDGGGHNNVELILRENGIFFTLIKEFLREWVPTYSGIIDSDEATDLVDFRSASTIYTGNVSTGKLYA